MILAEVGASRTLERGGGRKSIAFQEVREMRRCQMVQQVVEEELFEAD